MNKDIKERDVFERLKDGEIIPRGDPQAHKMRDGFYATRTVLMKMNAATEASEIRHYLGETNGAEIDATTDIFTPLYVNYGKDIQIGRNVSINLDCAFLELGGIWIDDNVLIAPKVSLLSEGHLLDPTQRHALV